MKEMDLGNDKIGKLVKQFSIPCVISLGGQPIIGYNMGAGMYSNLFRWYHFDLLCEIGSGYSAIYGK